MNNFEIKEYVYCKDKKWIDQINNHVGKPLFIIINRAFMTTASSSKKYRYQELKKIPNFIIIDECHSSMANRTYELLSYMKYEWKSKIQGLSATPYRKGKSKTEFKIENINSENVNLDTKKNEEKLKNIFHKPGNITELNILSWFNLKEAIESGCVLPPVFHWFDIKNEKDSDEMEAKSVLSSLSEIVSSNQHDSEYNLKYKKFIVWCRTKYNAKKWFNNFNTYKSIYHNLSNLETFIDYSNIAQDFKDKEKDYDKFYNKQDNCIIFCASKFREGSDIPFLSCALFLDQVKNRGDLPFIQCIGRVLRKSEGKNCGHILDGYIIDNDKHNINNIIDKLLKYYLNLYEISKSDFNNENGELKSINKIKIYEDIMNSLNIKPQDKKIFIKLKNNKKITIDLENINLKTIKWNKLTTKFDKVLKNCVIFSDYDEYCLLKKRIKECKIKSKKSYLEFCTNETNFCKNPEKRYKEYWKNWYDFLGINTSKFIKTKQEWIKFCLDKNINEYNYHKKRKFIKKLPKWPGEFYNDFTNIRFELSKKNKKNIRKHKNNLLSNYV